MAVDYGKDRACVEALKKLRHLIEQEYRDGGWLPSGRVLSERFGVSHLTYRKALNCLVAENTARSHPRKGHYIPEAALRVRKIGIVLGSGGESPFLCDPRMLSSALGRLRKEGFHAHIIQSPRLGKIPLKALLHEVRGLLWFSPPPAAAPIIREICAEGELPLVILSESDPVGACDMSGLAAPMVSFDYDALGRERAGFFLARGHRKILYAGLHVFAEKTGFVKALCDAGVPFGPKDCVEEIDESGDALRRLLNDGRHTGLTTEGGDNRLEMVFKVVSSLPAAQRPELLVRECDGIPFLLGKYPGVKVSGIEVTDPTMCGDAAARMLAGRLNDGREMKSIRIPSCSIKQ